MALTPLVIPKRNQIELDYTTSVFIPVAGTLPGIILRSVMPYIQFNSNGTFADHNYAFGFIKGDGSVFGIYNPDPALDSGSGVTAISVKGDLSESFIAISNTDLVPHDGTQGYFNSGAISYSSYDLGPVASVTTSWWGSPPLGPANFNVGMENLDYGFTNGWAGLAGSTVSSPDGWIYTFDENGTYKNAFTIDTDFDPTGFNSNPTLTDGVFNYTLLDGTPFSGIGSSIYFTKWQPNPLDFFGGGFTETNYDPILSVGVDQTDWLAGLEYSDNNVYHLSGSNTDVFVVGLYFNTSNVPTFTVFIIANDLSWYDRINVRTDGSIAYPVFWLDVVGDNIVVGDNGSETTVATAVPAPETSASPPVQGMKISDIFKLPCFHPCVPNAKKGPVLYV